MERTAENYLRMAGLGHDIVSRMDAIGYFTAPASSRHHLSCEGGLAIHSMNVVDMMLELHSFDSPVSCYLVGMVHDLVKCRCYAKVPGGYKFVSSEIPGHGTASALIAAELGIVMTPVERAAVIWHMGSFAMTDGERESYREALKKWPRELAHSRGRSYGVFV